MKLTQQDVGKLADRFSEAWDVAIHTHSNKRRPLDDHVYHLDEQEQAFIVLALNMLAMQRKCVKGQCDKPAECEAFNRCRA